MIITDEIISLADPDFKEFNQKIVPNAEGMLGLRSPKAKEIAKKYANCDTGCEFMSSLPHKYYDENLVHAYMLGFLKEDNKTVKEKVIAFLPYVDNWAVCDCMTMGLKKLFKNPDSLYDFVKECLNSKETYTVRFALVCMLSYYITDKYIDEVLALANSVKSDEYYIKMAQAWLYSVALVKYYDKSVEFIKNANLDKWVHNKSIQKARESLRITNDKKDYLNSLKIK